MVYALILNHRCLDIVFKVFSKRSCIKGNQHQTPNQINCYNLSFFVSVSLRNIWVEDSQLQQKALLTTNIDSLSTLVVKTTFRNEKLINPFFQTYQPLIKRDWILKKLLLMLQHMNMYALLNPKLCRSN